MKLKTFFSKKIFLVAALTLLCNAGFFAQSEDSIFSIDSASDNDFITVIIEPNRAAIKKCVFDGFDLIRSTNNKRLNMIKNGSNAKNQINNNAQSLKDENQRKVQELLGIKTTPAAGTNTSPKASSQSPASSDSAREEKEIQAQNLSLSKREKFITYCLDQCSGFPYVTGGTSPRPGFDCSGVVQYAAKNSIGLKLPRTAREMYAFSEKIEKSQALPGDLIFFKAGGKISHVGVYLGTDTTNDSYKGREIFFNSASEPKRRSGTIISALTEPYWKRHYFGFGRIISE